MSENLVLSVINNKVLDKYREEDKSLDTLLSELEVGTSPTLSSPHITIMSTPTAAKEMLLIYERRIQLTRNSDNENRKSMNDIISYCRNQPDGFIQTVSITSRNKSYHVYLNSESFPISVIVSKPIPT